MGENHNEDQHVTQNYLQCYPHEWCALWKSIVVKYWEALGQSGW